MCEPRLNSQTNSPSHALPCGQAEQPNRPDSLDFRFCVAQKADQGEDADPLLLKSDFDDTAVLGVFDGLGGSGSTRYVENGVSQTGARIGSRIVRELAEKFFRGPHNSQTGDDLPAAERRAEALTKWLLDELRERIAQLEPSISGTRLGGKMMRRLPTTLACLSYRRAGAEFAYEAFWAGDSRCYVLTPSSGLQQISLDDLRSGADALENLLEDSSISNFVNADGAFKLNAAIGSSKEPAIFLVATDGCFNFCLSPAHFEHSILATLQRSQDMSEWREALRNNLESLAGDDLSMALIAAGWTSFSQIREAFADRLAVLSTDFIKRLDALDSQANETAELHKRLVSLRNELRNELWARYRQSYELFRKNSRKEVSR